MIFNYITSSPQIELTSDERMSLESIVRSPSALIRAWSSKDIDYFGTSIDLQERYRSQLSQTRKSPRTDTLLATARKCGAGARLIGAGVGRLFCYCPEEMQQELRERLGIPEIVFSIL